MDLVVNQIGPPERVIALGKIALSQFAAHVHQLY